MKTCPECNKKSLRVAYNYGAYYADCEQCDATFGQHITFPFSWQVANGCSWVHPNRDAMHDDTYYPEIEHREG